MGGDFTIISHCATDLNGPYWNFQLRARKMAFVLQEKFKLIRKIRGDQQPNRDLDSNHGKFKHLNNSSLYKVKLLIHLHVY